MVTESPRILVARKGLPVNNLQELVAYMKANQDKMQYSSAGVGSGTHLPCALLNYTLGVDVTHVPYRGEGPALQDVIADRIDYMCTTIQSGAVQAQAGHGQGHRGDGAAARRRSSPTSPPPASRALPGVEATVWNGFFFPKGTPKPIVDKMHKAIETVISKPDIRQKMEALGLEILPPEQRTPAYLAKFLQAGHRALGQGDQGRRHQRGLSAAAASEKRTQKRQLRVAVVAPLDLLEAVGRA